MPSLSAVVAPEKYLLYWLEVSVPKAEPPGPFSPMLTIHWPLLVFRAALTEVMSWPLTTAGPSTYLLPDASQETFWIFRLSHGEASSLYPGTVLFQVSLTVFAFGPGLQTSLSNSFIVAALTADGSP